MTLQPARRNVWQWTLSAQRNARGSWPRSSHRATDQRRSNLYRCYAQTRSLGGVGITRYLASRTLFPEGKNCRFFWMGVSGTDTPKKCRMPHANMEYWKQKIARNVARDRHVTCALQEKAWKVIRIWEDSVKKPSTVARLRKALA